jgi:hypothetical protein
VAVRVDHSGDYRRPARIDDPGAIFDGGLTFGRPDPLDASVKDRHADAHSEIRTSAIGQRRVAIEHTCRSHSITVFDSVGLRPAAEAPCSINRTSDLRLGSLPAPPAADSDRPSNASFKGQFSGLSDP